MDKQKQIEEMAKVVCGGGHIDYERCGDCFGEEDVFCGCIGLVERLYNAGVRKIPENAVVLTREEYDELKKGVKTYNYTAMFKAQDAYRWEQGYLQGCKETAEKIAERLKDEYLPIISGYFVDNEKEEEQELNSLLCSMTDEIAKEFTEGCDEGKET